MKVRAEVVDISYREVKVNASEVFKQMQLKWIKEIGRRSDQYINRDGIWESWEDTHGSGIYYQHGAASDQEVTIYNAFKLLEEVIKEKK